MLGRAGKRGVGWPRGRCPCDHFSNPVPSLLPLLGTAMSRSSPSRRASSCPRPSRRGLLTAGLAGLGGLGLVDLLRADATPAAVRRSVIHVHLDGGPPQMDTIDMKPDGPAEVRGEFSAIATAVPGIQVCELLPGLARLADRFAFLRAVVGSAGQHDAYQ